MSIRVEIHDDFLPDPQSFRERAVKAPYYDIRGPDGETYKHIHVLPSNEFEPLLEARLKRKVKVGYNILRTSYEGEIANASIHTDNSYDQFAAVLYLNPPEQCRGGTAFWKFKKYGFTHFPEVSDIRKIGKSPTRVYTEIHHAYNDPDQWEQQHVAEMRFNRLVCFETTAFHSRWPLAAFGNSTENARMIVAMFFSFV